MDNQTIDGSESSNGLIVINLPVVDDIRYFHEKLSLYTNPDAQIKLHKQIELLENSVVIYKN